MDKPFRPAPLEVLARWVFGELASRDTVMGIPRSNLAVPGPRLATPMFGRTLAALARLYAPANAELFALLGRSASNWRMA